MKPLSLRQWHAYIGLFIAPSVLFFALTGAIQLFGLHDSHGAYHPLAFIEKSGMLHKDQVFRLRHPPTAQKPVSAPIAEPAQTGGGEAEEDELPLPTLLLKIFFLLAAIGLAGSNLLGVWIALTRPQRKRTSWILLGAGALTPVILILV